MQPIDDYWALRPRQTTLRYPVWCRGVGLHSGVETRVELQPAPADTGIIFHKMLTTGEGVCIPAHIDWVKDGLFRTVFLKDGEEISTTEHLLAAVSALEIDNIIIKVWHSEIPILSGSAADWLFLLKCAGITELTQQRSKIRVQRTVTVQQSLAWCRLEPHHEFQLTYHLDYRHPLIGKQDFSIVISEQEFTQKLARARTFGFIKDLDLLKSKNLAGGAGLHNTVVFDAERVLNPGGLIWWNEPTRHKLIDAIGDLQLAGARIIGKFTGFCSGHTLNHLLVRELLSDDKNWCWG